MKNNNFLNWALLVVVFTFVVYTLGNEASNGELRDSLLASVGRNKNIVTESSVEKGGKAGKSEDYILIKFKENIGQSKKDEILSKHKLKEKTEIKGIGVKMVYIGEDDTVDEVLNRINNTDKENVEFVEADEVVAPEVIPNDQYYSSQWALPKISAPLAWDSGTSSTVITVGIADTGVDCSHLDLAQNCVAGWNFYDNNSNTSDVHGHGTKVAGTVSSVSNNLIGVSGVSWNAKIMPLRISDLAGYGSWSAMANSIVYAADRGVRVVNMSYRASESSAIKSAAEYLNKKGGVITISAGNQSENVTLPDNPYVLTVGGSDSNDVRYSWSNYGSIVDVFAPGSVYTTSRGGGYSGFSGTSASAPVVAGLAAFVISKNPSLSANDIQNLIKQNTDDIGATGFDPIYSYGRVNMNKTLQAALNTTTPSPVNDTSSPSSPSNLSATAIDSSRVNLSWINSSDNVGVDGYEITRNSQIISTTKNNTYSDSGVLPATTYSYSVRAYDANKNYSSSSNLVSVTTPVAPSPTLSISSFQVLSKTNTTATIKWTTNIPSSGSVIYGTSKSSLGGTVTSLETNGTTHTVTLTNLNPATNYYYSIKAVGGGTTVTSSVSSFRTLRK